MLPLVECIPNISEGRDLGKINSICEAAKSVPGLMLLNVDVGYDANRTVVTMAGTPDVLCEAVFRFVKRASELIDMRFHHGIHPRIGAVDVIPFVPLVGLSRVDCLERVSRLGHRVGEELGIPVFLYEYSAQQESRKNLADIRRGEYEGLSDKLKNPKWQPDFGPVEFNPKFGAAVVGVRDFLIAFNVSLSTTDKNVASKIASRLRSSGRLKKNHTGSYERIPGILTDCKAIGWYLESCGQSQVSMNLTKLSRTGLFEAYTSCKKVAEEFGVEILASELIGMMPLAEIIRTGREVIAGNSTEKFTEQDLVSIAVDYLKLPKSICLGSDSRILEDQLRKYKAIPESFMLEI